MQELITKRGGFRLATSVGGILTGRGADCTVIVDLLKPGDAMSDSRRVAANGWFDDTLYSRLNDKTDGPIVITCSACTRTISSAMSSSSRVGTGRI